MSLLVHRTQMWCWTFVCVCVGPTTTSSHTGLLLLPAAGAGTRFWELAGPASQPGVLQSAAEVSHQALVASSSCLPAAVGRLDVSRTVQLRRTEER